ELPSEAASNPSEHPPPTQEVLTFRRLETPPKIFFPTFLFQISLDLLFQRLQHARHCHQHRHSLAADCRHHLRRSQCVLENDSSTQQLRQEHPEKLSENVAQRQQIQKADGMHQPLILQVFGDLLLERCDIGKHVGMADHH